MATSEELSRRHQAALVAQAKASLALWPPPSQPSAPPVQALPPPEGPEMPEQDEQPEQPALVVTDIKGRTYRMVAGADHTTMTEALLSRLQAAPPGSTYPLDPVERALILEEIARLKT